MGAMAFVGWWLLLLFGGLGLSALPMDLIREFIDRPKPITSKEAAAKKIFLRSKSKELIGLGTSIKEKEGEA
jgi:LMBR1 domain-containing protein 1